MQRRDLLRMLATGAALQLAPPKMFAVMRETRALLLAQTAPRTLSPPQEAMLRVLTELILPRTDTPGATDVGTTAFIDLILTEWSEDAERTSFLNGLADVDDRTQSLFGKAFVECSSAQQSQILAALGDEMLVETSDMPTRRGRRRLGGAGSQKFYPMLRRLTLVAYYTSEAGATQELHYEIIPEQHQECAQTAPDKEA
jgi:Gluconate 2-dehydrogenase subunit 3